MDNQIQTYLKLLGDIMTEEIRFYRTNEEYGCFSNFSKHSFEVDGLEWKTSEHFYQAMKFAGTPFAEEARLLATPREVADFGRRKDLPFDPENWDKIKDAVMFYALLEKFGQNPDIKQILISTGSAILIEDSPTDYYWGVGKDGSGRNMLGIMLGILRSMYVYDGGK